MENYKYITGENVLRIIFFNLKCSFFELEYGFRGIFLSGWLLHVFSSILEIIIIFKGYLKRGSRAEFWIWSSIFLQSYRKWHFKNFSTSDDSWTNFSIFILQNDPLYRYYLRIPSPPPPILEKILWNSGTREVSCKPIFLIL